MPVKNVKENKAEANVEVEVKPVQEEGWATVSKKQVKKSSGKSRNDLYIQCKVCKFHFDFPEQKVIDYKKRDLALPKTCQQCIERRKEMAIKKF